MSFLWKKESRYENALYIDIFRKLGKAMMFMSGDNVKSYFECAEETMFSRKRSEKSNDKSELCRKLGDVQFQQKMWKEALTLYNRSLCLAKLGSEQMGIAYAKRAQCFFQLKMYDKCLMDLDLARFSSYPKEHFDLLSMREEECLKKMADGTVTASIIPALSFNPHKKYPEMANVLKIHRASDDQWQIVATKDICVGQIILVEKSFVSTFTESYKKCCVCSITLTNLVPCNGCSKALLCAECNNTIIHKVECDANVLFHGKYNSVSDTFRSILLAMTIFDDANELIEFVEQTVAGDLSRVPNKISDPKSKYRAFLHPAQKSNDLKEDAALAFIQYAALLAQSTVNCYFQTEKQQRFLMHLIFHHLRALKGRGISTSEVGPDTTNEETDYGLILGMNFAHSCAPHVIMHLSNGHAVMTTLRPIKKGQEIFLACNELILFNELDERQKSLDEEFGVKCQCERCEYERNDNEDQPVNINLSMLADPNFQYIAHRVSKDEKINLANSDELIERVERILNMYGHQKWDEYIGSIITFYMYLRKMKHDQFEIDCN